VLSRIEILEPEESVLLDLAPYAGNTPRQLKRFLNLYRVIKASANGDEFPWQATMFLLAIATAAPDRFAGFLRVLKQLGEDADLRLLKSSWASAAEPDKCSDSCLKALTAVEGSINITQLREQAPIVARFSFCEEEWFRAAPHRSPSLALVS